MRTLEPTIHELAVWMRDGTWLDMRTPMGRAFRVRVISMLITPEADSIAIEQQWVNEDDRRKDRTFSFDAEEVWDCRPTTVGLLDVVPLVGRSAPHKPSDSQIEAHFRAVADAVFDAMCLLFDYLDRKTLIGKTEYVGSQYVVHHRHQAIIAIYEMTDLSPNAICTELMGYGSQQPWLTARYKCRGDDDAAKGMRDVIKRVDALVTARMGVPQRRSSPVPGDYKLVLK